MDGDDGLRAELGLEDASAIARDFDVGSEERSGGGRAEGDEHAWLQRGEFGFEPRTAGGDVEGVGRFQGNANAFRALNFLVLRGASPEKRAPYV